MMENAKDKLKAIDAAVGAIEKQFGKGAIMRLGKGDQPLEATPPGNVPG